VALSLRMACRKASSLGSGPLKTRRVERQARDEEEGDMMLSFSLCVCVSRVLYGHDEIGREVGVGVVGLFLGAGGLT
jgi:hypothetical protein